MSEERSSGVRRRDKRDHPAAMSRGGRRSGDADGREGIRGAGAALARDEGAGTQQTPAGSDVTADGRGKRTGTGEQTHRLGGWEVTAPFLRLGRAGFTRSVCKNGE